MPFAKGFYFGIHGIQVVIGTADMIMETAYPVNKGLGFFFSGFFKYLLWRAFFIDDPFIHIEHPGRDILGKFHLVGNNEHGHARFGQTANDRQNLAYHGGIKSRGRLVK
ncbi:hypothetical protein SDC9_179907 [bioreactor metagenome]|uniref:Uncharacterized protein n=1 Tax=bioreactor metagenome TaxID=1076179 RepID=A0A645H356_9ZZZZ